MCSPTLDEAATATFSIVTFELWAEGVFVEAHNGRLSGMVVLSLIHI